MRRAAVALALPALLGAALGTLAACTDRPPRAASPGRPSPVTVSSSIPTTPSPTPPRSAIDICAQARQMTTALGPAVVGQFRAEGLPPAQVLDRTRAVYQLAEAGLAGLRGQATDGQLASALGAVEVQYREIRIRLKKPEDVDRVNLQPAALRTALTNLDRACR